MLIILLSLIILLMYFRELHLHWGQCKYKGKTYRSYSLARAYRKDGKNRKKIICSLGKLTEEEATNWQVLLKPNFTTLIG